MAENTQILWADSTFNPWVGCQKISPGCKECYAAELMTPKPRWANTWGPAATTERLKTKTWNDPIKWNRQATKQGKRIKVFCASLADVFEDNPQLIDWRIELFELIKQTPNLDWQILTKRPDFAADFFRLRPGFLLPNVWMGTSIENQEMANKRLPELAKIPARVRFLSVEPMLDVIDLFDIDVNFWPGDFIDWVIVGGESGPNARPMKAEWAENMLKQCRIAQIPFFFKQMGGRGKDKGGHYLNKVVYQEMPRSSLSEVVGQLDLFA